MLPVVLAVGDTTYLDYKADCCQRDGYGPIGNGGNGLILHESSSRAASRTVVGLVAETLASGSKPHEKPQAEKSPYLRRAQSRTRQTL